MEEFLACATKMFELGQLLSITLKNRVNYVDLKTNDQQLQPRRAKAPTFSGST